MQTTKVQWACTSRQSDQHLCCSLLWQYNISSFYIGNFNPLASFCSSADLFESYLVESPKDRFSRDEVQFASRMSLLGCVMSLFFFLFFFFVVVVFVSCNCWCFWFCNAISMGNFYNNLYQLYRSHTVKEVSVLILDFPVSPIHSNFSFSSK